MDQVIRLSKQEEQKALPILLRHSQGTVLPERTYVLSSQAVQALRDAGIEFTELSGTGNSPVREGVGTGERI